MAFVTCTGYHMVMKRVGMADLKAHLSGHIRTVRKGETLLVMDRGTPVARIVPAADPAPRVARCPRRRDERARRGGGSPHARPSEDLEPLDRPTHDGGET